MNLIIENRLDMSTHVTAVRHGATEITLIVASDKRLVLCGEVLRHECLFPGTALALRNFDGRTRFTLQLKGFDGSTVEMNIGKSADDPETMLVSLLSRKTKMD